MVRSAAFPRGGRAILVSALAGLACDRAALNVDDAPGGAADPFQEDVSSVAPDTASKIDPRVGLDRHGVKSREVVVLLDDQALRAAFLSSAIGGVDAPGGMDAMAAGLDRAKDRVLGRMGQHRAVALGRYSHLPVMHLEVDSDQA